jgi:hypothetical protein
MSLHENSRFRLGPYEVKETVSLPRNKSEEFWGCIWGQFQGGPVAVGQLAGL